MKVLQINSVCGTGSTGRIATDIHSLLQEQDYQSRIAYGRGSAINYENTIKIGNKLNNYMHVAKTRIFDTHGFGSKKATEKFLGKVEEYNPDIIHLHNIHGYYINIEILFDYLKKTNKPVIWTLHDCWAFTGHCAYFEYAGCKCWEVEGNYKCIQKRSYPSSILFNNSRENHEMKKNIFTGVENLTIVTPSKWLANLVKQSFLREYPVSVINNGVNLRTFKPTLSEFRKKNNINNKFIILGVSNVWESRKGFDYFIKLSKEISDEEVIVLVGLEEKQLNNLPFNIIGITRTNNIEELAEIYSAADVFVNPTLEDNFPTTNLEAIACGTPVVTFDTGGSSESIDNNSGLVVEKGNIDELVKKIYLIKSKGKNAYEKKTLERAEKYYNNTDRFNDYIELYKVIIQK